MVQQRLLDIAVEAFGRHGLDGASTREIAKAAGTAMSSITYHYGGKEGLYLAVADHVAEQMDEILPADVIEAALGNQDADRAREALRTALRLFVVKLQNPQSDGWTLFIMREQMNPTEAFERIYAKRMGGMLDALVSLICLASGTEDREAAKLTAISLLGQVLVLKAARAMCRKLLDRDTLEPAILESYADRLAANVDATLDRMIAERRLTTRRRTARARPKWRRRASGD